MTVGTEIYVLILQFQRQKWAAHNKQEQGSTTVLEHPPPPTQEGMERAKVGG